MPAKSAVHGIKHSNLKLWIFYLRSCKIHWKILEKKYTKSVVYTALHHNAIIPCRRLLSIFRKFMQIFKFGKIAFLAPNIPLFQRIIISKHNISAVCHKITQFRWKLTTFLWHYFRTSPERLLMAATHMRLIDVCYVRAGSTWRVCQELSCNNRIHQRSCNIAL